MTLEEVDEQTTRAETAEVSPLDDAHVTYACVGAHAMCMAPNSHLPVINTHVGVCVVI